MKEFYLERVKDGERQVKYAKVGYEQEIRKLAEMLAKCKPEEADGIIKEINAAKRAMSELEKTQEYNLQAYRGSCLVDVTGGKS